METARRAPTSTRAARPAPRRAPRPAPRRAPRPSPRPPAGGLAAAARVRWDRVGRVALLLVLLGVVALYVEPARSYFTTWGEADRAQATVRRLERENGALARRARALRDPRTLAMEARRLGLVRPGERSYVLRDLPRGR